MKSASLCPAWLALSTAKVTVVTDTLLGVIHKLELLCQSPNQTTRLSKSSLQNNAIWVLPVLL